MLLKGPISIACFFLILFHVLLLFYEPQYIYCLPGIAFFICVEIILDQKLCHFPPKKKHNFRDSKNLKLTDSSLFLFLFFPFPCPACLLPDLPPPTRCFSTSRIFLLQGDYFTHSVMGRNVIIVALSCEAA